MYHVVKGGTNDMITVMLKLPEQDPETREIDSIQTIEEWLEGEFEMIEDDQLSDIHILINEEARGVQPHNFTILSEGAHDWVYGPAVFISVREGQVVSLNERQIKDIKEYFSSVRPYK